jgi:hypothetical protein
MPKRPRIIFKDAVHTAQKTHGFSVIKPASHCWKRKLLLFVLKYVQTIQILLCGHNVEYVGVKPGDT